MTHPATLRAAGLLGTAVRKLRHGAPSVSGVLGAATIVFGVGQMYRPLGWVTAGVFLLVVDWRGADR